MIYLYLICCSFGETDCRRDCSADKVQVQDMVTRILKLSDKPQADAADALAIAITHAHTIQHSLHIAGSVKTTETHEKMTALLKTRYSRGRFRLKI